jgi:hypothetical protein
MDTFQKLTKRELPRSFEYVSKRKTPKRETEFKMGKTGCEDVIQKDERTWV